MKALFRLHARIVIAALAWALLALPAHAASFDCTKAKSKVEHLVCDNPELSKLDDELAASFDAALYEAALQGKTNEQETRQAQQVWLKARNRCANVACVKSAYQSRAQAIEQSKQAPQGIAMLYGKWEGSGKASEAIYGMMEITKSKITWKGYSRVDPRCTVLYEQMSEADGTQFKDLFGHSHTISAGSKFKSYLLKINGKCALKIKYFRMTLSDSLPDYLDMNTYYEGLDEAIGYMGFYKR